MNLVLSVDALRPPLTGIGRYVRQLASGLAAHTELDSVRYVDQHRWVTLDASQMPSRPSSRLTARVARGLIRRTNPTLVLETLSRMSARNAVVHGPNYFLPRWAKEGIITVHDLSVFKFPETHPSARLKHFEAEFKSSLNRARHVITDSESTRCEVISYFGLDENNVTAIPLGTSSSFRPRSNEEINARLTRLRLKSGEYTLCVSTMEPRKRLHKLIEAYSRLPQATQAAFPLVLTGAAGWLQSDLLRDVQLAQDAGWLINLGYVEDTELHSLYSGARLFVYPSIYEGFGLPVLEAMASGVPVVTSNRSSLPEVAGNAGLLFDPDNPDAFLDALNRGLTDDDWRGQAAERGLARAKSMTWERCVDATVDVYRRLK